MRRRAEDSSERRGSRSTQRQQKHETHMQNHCLATRSRLVCILKDKLAFKGNPADFHLHQEEQKAFVEPVTGGCILPKQI